MKNIRNFLSVLCMLIVLLTSLGIYTVGYARQKQVFLEQTTPTTTICIVNPPDSTNFPDISVEFRAIDSLSRPITTITASELRVVEAQASSVPVQRLLTNSNRQNIDLLFISDRSNRSTNNSQRLAGDILQNFLNRTYQDGDRVWLYHNNNNRTNVSNMLADRDGLTQAISAFPSSAGGNIFSLRQIFSDIGSRVDQLNNGCQRTTFVVLMLGDEVLQERADVSAFPIEVFPKNHARLAILHVPYNGAYRDEAKYRELLEKVNGDGDFYFKVDAPDDVDVINFFSILQSYRETKTAIYTTDIGVTGTRQFSLNFRDSVTKGMNTYNVDPKPPVVNLLIDSPIERNAIETTATGYKYDKNSVEGQIEISWVDGYPARRIEQNAVVSLLPEGGNVPVTIPVALREISLNVYQFTVPLDLFPDSTTYTFNSVSIQVTDQLGSQSTSQNIRIDLISTVSMDTHIGSMPWIIWLIIALGGVIFLMLIGFVVMWRKFGSVSAVGNELRKGVENVRKTIVGGRRGKPIATLKILEGPPTLVGQELKIYTETVRLGRDPQKADLTFYTPDSNSSISGLHCRIERVNGSWRIVAESKSGSETFIDDEPIPMFEPRPITNEQKIRLGYPAQQPVIFEFRGNQSTPRTTEVGVPDIRQTDVGDVSDGFLKKISPDDEKEVLADGESPFDKFRNRK